MAPKADIGQADPSQVKEQIGFGLNFEHGVAIGYRGLYGDGGVHKFTQNQHFPLGTGARGMWLYKDCLALCGARLFGLERRAVIGCFGSICLGIKAPHS